MRLVLIRIRRFFMRGFKMYDVAIVGAGPAGATFARLLSEKYSAVIIDGSEALCPKPCGGLLAPDAQKQLARFGLSLPKDVLVSPQIFCVKTIDTEAKIVRHYQRSYINMNRQKFDRWLLSLVPNRVKTVNGTAMEVSREDGIFKIKVDTPNGSDVLYAKNLVGADGAGSLVRKTFFKNISIRSYVAVQQWFKEKHDNPFYSCIFDRQSGDCCSWSVSKDDYFIFGGAYEKDGSRKRFETAKKDISDMGFVFSEAVKIEACLVNRPRSLKELCVGGDNVYLVGEAAGFISPSSLEGISFALISGEMLAQSFNSGDNPGKRYKKLTKKIYLKTLGKILKCPFMYNPLLRKAVMRSGIRSIKVINK